MLKKIGVLIITVIALLAPFGAPISAWAQSYSFSLDKAVVDVYMNADGTLDVVYRYTFDNDPGGAPIDFVDIGLPNQYFNPNAIQATVDGQPAAYISESEYQADGSGVAVALGSSAIPPGSSGEVAVLIQGIERMLHPDSQDQGYASMVFSPNWFGSEFVHGNTDMQVTFHLPPGVAAAGAALAQSSRTAGQPSRSPASTAKGASPTPGATPMPTDPPSTNLALRCREHTCPLRR